MVRLDDLHPAMVETIRRIVAGENTVPIAALRDFDTNEFLLHVHPIPEIDPAAPKRKKEVFDESRTTAPEGKIHISIRHQVKKEVLNKFKNLQANLDYHFAPLGECCRVLETPADSKSTLTLEIDIGSPKADAAIAKASQLRTILLQAPIFHVFESFLKNPASVPSLRIPYRPKESMYVFGYKGQSVMVVLSILVTNPEDRLFMRNALQAFQDVRKTNRATAQGPAFEFSPGKAPADIPADIALGEPREGGDYYWCTFGLSKSHFDKRQRMETTVRQLGDFRNYVNYHVNCMRSVLHLKMRQRVAASLQVLNRAKTATTGKSRTQIK
jgi:hypothetical protein